MQCERVTTHDKSGFAVRLLCNPNRAYARPQNRTTTDETIRPVTLVVVFHVSKTVLGSTHVRDKCNHRSVVLASTTSVCTVADTDRGGPIPVRHSSCIVLPTADITTQQRSDWCDPRRIQVVIGPDRCRTKFARRSGAPLPLRDRRHLCTAQRRRARAAATAGGPPPFGRRAPDT
jgi:hypothetical protein